MGWNYISAHLFILLLRGSTLEKKKNLVEHMELIGLTDGKYDPKKKLHVLCSL